MNEATVFQRISSLADATRGRLLAVLDRHELTVGELCGVVQLPQSTVSRHLRVLLDEGWVVARSEGTSRYYRLATRMEPGALRLWEVVREALAESVEAEQDEARAAELIARRRTRSQEFFSNAASEWDGVRAELFGRDPELRALLALLDPSWTVGDLGCGTGSLTETVAPHVGRVIAVDESADMLEGAERRLAAREGGGDVELRRGRLEALPIDDAELDLALLSLVLHYVPAPDAAIAEAARALTVGGRLLVLDMQPHGREEYREEMGHLWQGFSREQIEGWMTAAGLEPRVWLPMAPDPDAKGPLLFTAVGKRA